MIGPDDVKRLRGEARAARRAIGRALRRPGTYPMAVKELLWTGVNVAMYPAGVLGEAFEPESSSGSLRGRYARSLPFHYLEPEAAATPIILLHGYFHNRSGFLVMRRAFRRHGFRHVHTMNYNVIGHDVEELAAQLSGYVERVLNRTGATRVHLVGHSLGGLVARTYVQEYGGDSRVHTCITLGTPHNGTYAAWMGRGRAARQIRPRSELLDRLDRTARPSSVRFISYYSNLDPLVVPASSAKITNKALRATNVLVKDHGHMSLLLSSQLIRSVVSSLTHLDDPKAPSPVTNIPKRSNGRRRATGS
jgi:pimeloyl-ACP methyl ester carboxylesterase